MDPRDVPTATAPQSLVDWTQIIYGLQALSLVIGIVGTATVIGAFLFGWPSIIAVIMSYIKRGDMRGTWLESHCRWQLRTFWFGLLWVTLCTLFVVVTLGIGLIIAWQVFDKVFQPLFIAAVNLLYPGVSYG